MVNQDLGKTIVAIVFFLGIAFVVLSLTNQFDITDISLKTSLFFLILGTGLAISLNLIFGKNLDNLTTLVSVMVLVGIGFLFVSFPELIPVTFSSVEIQDNTLSNALTGNNFTNFPWLGIILALLALYTFNKPFRENIKMFFKKLKGSVS